MSLLSEKYQKEIRPKLAQELGIKNPMAIPALEKVVINMGIGDIKDSRDEQERVVADMANIAGQKPSVRLARKSIAGFNLREGQPVGVSATLRGERMYNFVEKLFNIVLPRLRDFRGISRTAIDNHGNYTLGLTEHTVFPEIDLAKVGRVRGLEITLVTNVKDKETSLRLLEELGAPFEKE